MGSCSFQIRTKELNAPLAFNALVAQAQYEHGHAGYTGTIAEKTSWEIGLLADPANPRVPEFVLEAEAQKFINDDLEDLDKYGPAHVVFLKDEAGKPSGLIFYGWASS